MFVSSVENDVSPINSSMPSTSIILACSNIYKDKEMNLEHYHISFKEIQNDNSPGGKLVKISLINIIRQMGKNLPIFLTPKGIKAASAIANMLNTFLQTTTNFCSDKKLFLYLLNSSSSIDYKVHFDISVSGKITTVRPPFIISKGMKQIKDITGEMALDDSGVYAFFYNKDGDVKLGLGSALCCKTRLKDHISSFKNHRVQQFMHKFIQNVNGIDYLSWSPLITCANIVQTPIYNENISLGASKMLRAFGQFHLRVIEQAMVNKYKPTLTSDSQEVIFFNFNLNEAKDFSISAVSFTKRYVAFDITITEVLAQANSYNSLAKMVGLSNVTVRNTIN